MPIWRPEAILFDVHDTLFNPESLRKHFEQEGLPDGALDVWLARVQRDGIAHAASGTFAAYEDLATFHLHSLFPGQASDTGGRVERIQAALRRIPSHPDTESALERIRAEQVRRATLTNEPAELVSGWLEHSGLRNYFDGVFDASAAMEWKPRSGAYTQAASELGSAIERTALISTQPWDVHGATCAGLIGVWLNRERKGYPEMMNPPHIQGSTLDSLVDELLQLPRW